MIEQHVAEVELQSQRLTYERRGEDLVTYWRQEGFLTGAKEMEPDRLLAFADMATCWYTKDEAVQLTPEIASDIVLGVSTPMGEHFARMRHESMPPEYLFGRRLEHLTLAVLGQLEARANWHRIAREWVYDAEPVTELGKAEAAWLASRRA